MDGCNNRSQLGGLSSLRDITHIKEMNSQADNIQTIAEHRLRRTSVIFATIINIFFHALIYNTNREICFMTLESFWQTEKPKSDFPGSTQVLTRVFVGSIELFAAISRLTDVSLILSLVYLCRRSYQGGRQIKFYYCKLSFKSSLKLSMVLT